MKNNNALLYFFVLLVSFLLFVPFIGNMHLFDWDEINFAECAREMVLTGDYSKVQLNFKPFWEKPPVFIWFQAVCMNVFGINEFAARLPNAICGILTLLILFHYGKRYFSLSTAVLWCLLFTGSILPHLYFKSGLIDPWFNLFMFLSVLQFIFTINNFRSRSVMWNAILTGVYLGLAVLTKGPVAIVIIGMVILVSVFITKQTQFLISKNFVLLIASVILISMSWFGLMFLTGHSDVVHEFISYQVRLFETADAGHDGPLYYHLIVLLVGCFPASLLFLQGLKSTEIRRPFEVLFKKVMLVLFFVVLILFSIVKTKIVHYSSMCYFPLTFIGALYLSEHSYKMELFKRWYKYLYVVISIVLILAIILVCSINWLKPFIISGDFIKDNFALSNLKADVHWSGWEWSVVLPLISATFIFLYLKRFTNQQQMIYTGIGLYALFISLTLNLIVPKVEMYTQNAAIVFYQQVSSHKFDVDSYRFKSYACIFYGGRTPETFNDAEQIDFIEKQLIKAEREGHSRFSSYSTAYCDWLKYGNIKRPAFLVSKIQDANEIDELKTFKRLYERNGFVFFVRMPVNKLKVDF
jgi:4-amino-4-deoxy-L-arabinose transferase-like glycosyltransferase